MKTLVFMAICLVLVFGPASVTSAQEVLSFWQVAGLVDEFGTPVTDLELHLELGRLSTFKVWGVATAGTSFNPAYGSGFISADNLLILDFTLSGNTLEMDVDLNQIFLSGEIRLFGPGGFFFDSGTVVLSRIE